MLAVIGGLSMQRRAVGGPRIILYHKFNDFMSEDIHSPSKTALLVARPAGFCRSDYDHTSGIASVTLPSIPAALAESLALERHARRWSHLVRNRHPLVCVGRSRSAVFYCTARTLSAPLTRHRKPSLSNHRHEPPSNGWRSSRWARLAQQPPLLQSTANKGFFWWEVDCSYYILKMLSWVGVV